MSNQSQASAQNTSSSPNKTDDPETKELIETIRLIHADGDDSLTTLSAIQI